MGNLDFNDKAISNYIMNKLHSSRIKLSTFPNAKFHHNTSYKNAPLVCKHGILTLLDLNSLGIRNYSKEILEKLDDVESHINGNSGVSLAIVGLKDLYDGEDEYDPFDYTKIDFTLDNSVIAYRNSYHYGNEYMCYFHI